MCARARVRARSLTASVQAVAACQVTFEVADHGRLRTDRGSLRYSTEGTNGFYLFQAHRALLAATSPVFEELLWRLGPGEVRSASPRRLICPSISSLLPQTSPVDGHAAICRQVVQIADVPHSVFALLLDFCYGRSSR